MIAMIFPDGQQRTFPVGTTGMEIAKGISSSLAKKAVAIRVDGHLLDLTRPLTAGGAFAIVTRDEDAALEVLRHDAAHVFAEAIKELFPAAQITIGPSIENGFYYDIHMEERILTPEDFPLIEKRMHEIVDRDEAITREVWDRQEAIAFFSSCGEHYKAEIIRDIPGEEPISLYRQGQFIDLCRGPHLPSTKALGHAFKLMRVAGAYWRGDSKNPMLQRIYGTAWATEAQLQAYLMRLEEAEKRDHRRLGKEMNLFHMQEEAVGSVFWHPKGWALYRALESYMRRQLQRRDYQEVRTPQLLDKALWEASGHWEKFREGMFVLEDEDKSTLCLKPMNCPAHVQIFKQGLKSYRDLPYRLAEFGSCHRNEPSGALHGIMRVRAFTQDDAHIFCTPQQISDETIAFCRFLEEVYRDLGFDDFFVKFSDRPEKRAGSDETWDEAEEALKKGSEAAGLQWILNPGEGAFYGPKLEFVLRDAIGREWQCGTLQVDFVLPDRLDASYIGEDGKKHRPVMLHRAILGSFERFIGVLIEHYAGKFPFWLAPVQVAVVTITQEGDEFARAVHQQLSQSGVRAELDLRNEKINYKVREHSLQKIPLILAIGRREAENLEVSMRRLGSTDQTVISWAEAFEQIIQDAMPPC